MTDTIKDALLQRISNQIESQTAKGVTKYGHTLDDCDFDKYDWLEVANQELIDLAQYQQKEIRRLRRENKRLEDYTEALEGAGL